MPTEIEDNTLSDIPQWDQQILKRLFMKLAVELGIYFDDVNKNKKRKQTQKNK